MFKIKIEKEISTQYIEDVLVTALEGGSNYWYLINEENDEKIRNATPELEGQPFVDRLIKTVIDLKIPIEIHDLEDEEEKLGEITVENIQRGLNLYANSRGSFDLEDDMDASEADVLFQFIVMGEIVFG